MTARQDALRGAQQHDQQAEFEVGELRLLPAAVGKAPRAKLELPAVEAIGSRTVGASLWHPGAAAAQDGADPGEQLARSEGLGR